jgi:hypothetical protein
MTITIFVDNRQKTRDGALYVCMYVCLIPIPIHRRDFLFKGGVFFLWMLAVEFSPDDLMLCNNVLHSPPYIIVPTLHILESDTDNSDFLSLSLSLQFNSINLHIFLTLECNG